MVLLLAHLIAGYKEDLDRLVDGNLITNLSIDMYRGLFLKNKKQLFSIVQTEILTFIVVLILVIPATTIILRSSGNTFQETAEIYQLLLRLLALCLGLMLLINIYLWQQSQKNKSLALLIEKTEQYNNLIQAIKLVENLDSIAPSHKSESRIDQQQELMDTLKVIKESLLQALTVEKVLRKPQKIIEQHYNLLTNLESNLTVLMDWDLNHSSSQYRDLLQDAIEIGITVHKEVKKLQN